MYPGAEFAGKVFGFAGFGLDPGADYSPIGYVDGAYTYWTDFIFQAMFAATAATIVSGAVAERIKLMPFLLFATLLVAISYPITGMWAVGRWLAGGNGLRRFCRFYSGTRLWWRCGAGSGHPFRPT